MRVYPPIGSYAVFQDGPFLAMGRVRDRITDQDGRFKLVRVGDSGDSRLMLLADVLTWTRKPLATRSVIERYHERLPGWRAQLTHANLEAYVARLDAAVVSVLDGDCARG